MARARSRVRAVLRGIMNHRAAIEDRFALFSAQIPGAEQLGPLL